MSALPPKLVALLDEYLNAIVETDRWDWLARRAETRAALESELSRMQAVIDAARRMFDQLDHDGAYDIGVKYGLKVALAALDRVTP